MLVGENSEVKGAPGETSNNKTSVSSGTSAASASSNSRPKQSSGGRNLTDDFLERIYIRKRRHTAVNNTKHALSLLLSHDNNTTGETDPGRAADKLHADKHLSRNRYNDRRQVRGVGTTTAWVSQYATSTNSHQRHGGQVVTAGSTYPAAGKRVTYVPTSRGPHYNSDFDSAISVTNGANGYSQTTINSIVDYSSTTTATPNDNKEPSGPENDSPEVILIDDFMNDVSTTAQGKQSLKDVVSSATINYPEATSEKSPGQISGKKTKSDQGVVKLTQELPRADEELSIPAAAAREEPEKFERPQGDRPMPIYSYHPDQIVLVRENDEGESESSDDEVEMIDNNVKFARRNFVGTNNNNKEARETAQRTKDDLQVIMKESDDEEFLRNFERAFHEVSNSVSAADPDEYNLQHQPPPPAAAEPKSSISDNSFAVQRQHLEIPQTQHSQMVHVNVTISSNAAAEGSQQQQPLYVLSISIPTSAASGASVVESASEINVSRNVQSQAADLGYKSMNVLPPPQPPASPPPIWSGGECECSCPCMDGLSPEELDNLSSADDNFVYEQAARPSADESNGLEPRVMSDSTDDSVKLLLPDNEYLSSSSSSSVEATTATTSEEETELTDATYYSSSSSPDYSLEQESTATTAAANGNTRREYNLCPLPPEPTILILEGKGDAEKLQAAHTLDIF